MKPTPKLTLPAILMAATGCATTSATPTAKVPFWVDKELPAWVDGENGGSCYNLIDNIRNPYDIRPQELKRIMICDTDGNGTADQVDVSELGVLTTLTLHMNNDTGIVERAYLNPIVFETGDCLLGEYSRFEKPRKGTCVNPPKSWETLQNHAYAVRNLFDVLGQLPRTTHK
jgi:hypothetical protein